MDARLPTHIEVTGLIRAMEAAGGFGTVIAKGERDAGTLLVICCQNGANARAFERMPQMDGTRAWTVSREQDAENPFDFSEWTMRRRSQDSDLWIVELDGAEAEQVLTGVSAKG